MADLKDEILESEQNLEGRLDRLGESYDEIDEKINNIGKKADELLEILEVINQVKRVKEKNPESLIGKLKKIFYWQDG